MQQICARFWPISAVIMAVTLVAYPRNIVTHAQEQAPAPVAPGAAAPGGGGRGGFGPGRGGGRGFSPTMTPSALRAIPAETTAAKVANPNWKAPRTAWGHPDLEGIWTSDDMRGIPTSRPQAQADREFLTPEEFARRAGVDESSRDRAVNQETFLRNEFGVRTFGYTSFVVDPPSGQLPHVTPAAAARRKAMANVGTFGQGPFNTFEDFSLYDRCITRGRWEGDTLVVETTNFTDRTGFSGLHSDRLKLTEWFTRIDPKMIDYRIRVDDPATWVAPFTVRFTITEQPGYQLYEYSCHEGNGAVGYALSGERAYDKMVEEAKAKGLPIPPRTMGMEVYSGAPVEGRQPVREFGGGT